MSREHVIDSESAVVVIKFLWLFKCNCHTNYFCFINFSESFSSSEGRDLYFILYLCVRVPECCLVCGERLDVVKANYIKSFIAKFEKFSTE